MRHSHGCVTGNIGQGWCRKTTVESLAICENRGANVSSRIDHEKFNRNKHMNEKHAASSRFTRCRRQISAWCPRFSHGCKGFGITSHRRQTSDGASAVLRYRNGGRDGGWVESSRCVDFTFVIMAAFTVGLKLDFWNLV